MIEVIIAIGFLFVIEGLLYVLFPRAMKNMMAIILSQSENSVRTTGLFALLIGVIIIYVAK